MKKYIVADGGGTKTKYAIIDGNKNELFSLVGPGTNPVHIGEKEAVRSLTENIEKLIIQSRTEEKDIAAAALFVPVLWRRFTELNNHFSFPCSIRSDTEAAVWAALGKDDGLVVLSGTGSFVKGRNNGTELLVGGWGSAFGDEGSGYALGIAALRYAAYCYDTGSHEDELANMIKDFYKIQSLEELKALQREPDMLKAGNVAALCPLLEKAAENSCNSAVEIISGQAKTLAEQAYICAARLAFYAESPFKLALTGGVVTNNTKIRCHYISALRARFPNAVIFLSDREPIEGAKDYISAAR